MTDQRRQAVLTALVQSNPASRPEATDLLFTLLAYGLAFIALLAPFVLILVGTLGRLL